LTELWKARLIHSDDQNGQFHANTEISVDESIDYDVNINHKPLIVKENEIGYGLAYKYDDEYIPQVTPSEDGQIKNGRTDSTTICEVKKLIKQLIKEEMESAVVKNIKAVVPDVEEYLKKPENIGIAFSQKEMETIDSIEVKADTKTANQLKYSSTDELSNKNKELVVIKKQNRYVGFFSLSEPVDVTADANPEETDLTGEKTPKIVVLIKVSRPLQGKQEALSILSNFITQLVGEFQIK
jgi:hypothetical protein